MMRTVSPVLAEFSSSCAFTRVVRVTIFPYTGCGTRRSIATTTVFCILSLTTRPVRTLREPRVTAPFVCVISAIGRSLLREHLLTEHSLESGDVAAKNAQAERVLERLRRAAELEAETLLLQFL